MKIVAEKLILFLVVFTIIYIGYYILVIRKYNKQLNNPKPKGKKKDTSERVEILYLINKYKIDINKIDKNQLLWNIAFTNSFIMSTAVVVISLEIIKGYLWQLLLGLVVLVPLILIGYHILGKKYKMQEKRGK